MFIRYPNIFVYENIVNIVLKIICFYEIHENFRKINLNNTDKNWGQFWFKGTFSIIEDVDHVKHQNSVDTKIVE